MRRVTFSQRSRMIDSGDGPLTELLTCGHVRKETDPEPFTAHRVIPYEGGWLVRSNGSWCPACVAAGRAPKGASWQEAWDVVARRRAADIRA